MTTSVRSSAMIASCQVTIVTWCNMLLTTIITWQ
jgi:hypothetical protein